MVKITSFPPVPPIPCNDPKLAALAMRLWPESLDYAQRNRAEWLRAVLLARRTAKGWLADPKEQLQ